ncbi:MAG: putative spermidine/putrescine transport system substrate-binding protein [Pseudonocardiales bacterium]|nr:putative spermidine/putrescine transport system substrate-binding protein [Pseudonocardiales bacterium]
MRGMFKGPERVAWTIAGCLVAFMAVFAVGCGSSSSGSGSRNTDMLQSLGKNEGEVDLVNWPGYVEPKWTKPFEQKTGCQVKNKDAGTSDEMVQLMRTGQYDGVSASGNATERLVDGGNVSPVNVDLVPNYKTIFADIKNQPYNTFDGVHYGIPHGRGANLLMWNPTQVSPPPTSWSIMLDPKKAAAYKGKISAYDDPIYIADAAVYLKAHDPSLKITNPYELDSKQFDAAVNLLKQQRANVGEYWSDAAKQISAFANGDDEVGTTWQYQYFALKADNKPVATIPGGQQGFLPSEGATGWSDTWMISSQAKHPNCMYAWMNWITSPKVNAEVAEFFGEAPAQSKSCALTSDPNFCDKYHAADPNFWKRVYYWQTPTADCGDSRGAVCKDYNDWVNAWTSIKG